MAKYETGEITNWEHNHQLVAKRVQLAGTNSQIISDTINGVDYVGMGARGLAESDDGWLLMKITTEGTKTKIQTAIDSWDNVEDADYA